MRIEEQLLWILDDRKDNGSGDEKDAVKNLSRNERFERMCRKQEEKIKRNVDFVHSLGLKCDSVGWCSLDLHRPDIEELLERISTFTLREGLSLRGWYKRQCLDFSSGWYLLDTKYLMGDGSENYGVADRHGDPVYIRKGPAYKIPKFTQAISTREMPIVSEEIRNCCIRRGFSGISFFWIKDTGKYNATQFFGMILENRVREYACDKFLSYSDSSKLSSLSNDHSIGSPLYQNYLALGGALLTLSQMFRELNVSLPDQLPKNEMPETDFAYIFNCSQSFSRSYALIRKAAAEALISDKVIRKESLIPVILYETEPEGYYIQTSDTIQYPAEDVVKKLEMDYIKLKNNPKPQRKASVKEALQLLKKTTKLNPKYFRKGLAKKALENASSPLYALVSDYYVITDGGYLSSEYHFLPYMESLEETGIYLAAIDKEELHTEKFGGLVISKCADGDTVILCDDGSVKRISHETMEVCESWDTVAQFFFDAISDQ